jgi:hypothetical protein
VHYTLSIRAVATMPAMKSNVLPRPTMQTQLLADLNKDSQC